MVFFNTDSCIKYYFKTCFIYDIFEAEEYFSSYYKLQFSCFFSIIVVKIILFFLGTNCFFCPERCAMFWNVLKNNFPIFKFYFSRKLKFLCCKRFCEPDSEKSTCTSRESVGLSFNLKVYGTGGGAFPHRIWSLVGPSSSNTIFYLE